MNQVKDERTPASLFTHKVITAACRTNELLGIASRRGVQQACGPQLQMDPERSTDAPRAKDRRHFGVALHRRVAAMRRIGNARRCWMGLALLAAVEVATAAAPSAAPPEPDRAELLYENHCVGCHTSVLHVRDDRRARSAAEVREYVRRWSGAQHLGWSENDVVDVSDFLLRRYYRFAPVTPTPEERGVSADHVKPVPVK